MAGLRRHRSAVGLWQLQDDRGPDARRALQVRLWRDSYKNDDTKRCGRFFGGCTEACST